MHPMRKTDRTQKTRDVAAHSQMRLQRSILPRVAPSPS
jgi:hypothetical protein